MFYHKKNNKTVLLAFKKTSDIDHCLEAFPSDEYRILKACDFMSLIDSLVRYRIDLIISEVELHGISMIHFIPFLRKYYTDIKLIIVLKNSSSRIELRIRQYNVLYVAQWPANQEILKSVAAKGLRGLDKNGFMIDRDIYFEPFR
jgi:two-component SAPR family response regulator